MGFNKIRKRHFFNYLYVLRGILLLPFFPILYAIVSWDNYFQIRLNADNKLFWPGFNRLEFRILELYTNARFIIAVLSRTYSGLGNYIVGQRFKLNTFAVYGFTLAVTILTGYVLFSVINSRNDVDDSKIIFSEFEQGVNSQLKLVGNSAKNLFGGETVRDGLHFTEIKSSPLSFVWEPSRYPLSKLVKFSVLMSGSDNWDISLECTKCASGSQDSWFPFYRRALDSYSYVRSFGKTSVYAKEQAVSWHDSDDIIGWLKSNVEKKQAVAILDKSYPLSNLANNEIDFREGSTTVIDKVMRGPNQFYVYLKDSLQLEVSIESWGAAENEPVDINLYDLDDTLILSDRLVIDGNDGVNAYDKMISGSLPKAGVYRLAFKGSTRWVIKNMKINTNKIVTTGKSLVLDPANLYTTVDSQRSINAFIWHDTALQTIRFVSGSEEKDMTIGEAELNREQSMVLSPGEYNILTSGDQYLDGSYFAFSKDNFFNPFIVSLVEPSDASYILSNIISYKVGSSSKYVEFPIATSQIEQAMSGRRVFIRLRNSDMENETFREDKLLESGYSNLGSYKSSQIWGINNRVIDTTGNSLRDWIGNNLPSGASLYLDPATHLLEEDLTLIQPPNGFIETNDLITDLRVDLRGDHNFIAYLKGNLNLEVVKEGAIPKAEDDIQIRLFDYSGKEKCAAAFSDKARVRDLNDSVTKLQCGGLAPGTYTIKISGKGSSENNYLLKNIAINTNKLMVEDKVLSVTPVTLFTENAKDTSLSFYYWHSDKDQEIQIRNESNTQNIMLGPEDLARIRQLTVRGGKTSIVLPKGDVLVKGTNFAFRQDQYFVQYPYRIVDDFATKTDYKVVIHNSFTPTYFYSAAIN